MNKIWITVKKDLRAIIRDKKSLAIMLLTPISIPIIMILFSFVYHTLSTGGNGGGAIPVIPIGVNYEASVVETQLAENNYMDLIFYENQEALDEAFKNEEILSYIIKENDEYVVYCNPNDAESLDCGTSVCEYLDQYNKELTRQYLLTQDVDVEQALDIITISRGTLTGSSDIVNLILFMGVIYSVMAISVVAITCVTDTIAGEKERGTLETLLTFPIKGQDIIAGKYIATTVACMITAILSSLMLVFSVWITCMIFPEFAGMSEHINISTILVTLALMVSFAVFVSGLCIAMTSSAKSYKEAQSSLAPVSYITIIPMLLQMLNITIDTKLSLIPIVSQTMLINEIVTGGISTFTVTGSLISICSTLVYSVILIAIIGKLYKSEAVLFSL